MMPLHAHESGRKAGPECRPYLYQARQDGVTRKIIRSQKPAPACLPVARTARELAPRASTPFLPDGRIGP